jgi:hypothetical protein
VETDSGRLAAVVQLGWSSMVSGVASGGASAPRNAPAVVVYVGLPPPSGELA